MFCTKCGSKLEDDARFCVNCGTAVEEADSTVHTQANVQPEVNVKPHEDMQPNGTVQPQANVQPEVNAKPHVDMQPNGNVQLKANMQQNKPKKKGLRTLLVCAAAIIVIALVVFGGSKILGNSSSDAEKKIVYVKDGSLYYVKNMDKDKEPIRIARLSNGYSDDTPFWYSSDAEMVYFVDEIDSDGYGVLYQFPLSKAKDDTSKNKELLEEIDSSVYYGMVTVLADDSILYVRENNKLYWYSNGNVEQVAKDVGYWAYSEKENAVIFTKSDSSGKYQLLKVTLDKKLEETEIDNDIDSFESFYANQSFMVYYKYADDKTNLYVAGASLEPIKVAKDIYGVKYVDAENKTVYYSVIEKQEKTYYEYVNDPYAEEDAALVEPNPTDYMTPVGFEQILSESDYNYYIVEWPEDISYFYEWLYYDDEVSMYYYVNGDNEQVFYYNEILDQWYAFDSAAYVEVYQKYETVADRINLRATLKEMVDTTSVENIFSYTYGGEAKEICKGVDVDTVKVSDGILYYQRTADSDKKTNIEELSSYNTYDMLSVLKGEEKSRKYYCINGASEYELDEDNLKGFDISPNGKQVIAWSYDEDGNSIIYHGSVSNGEIKDLDKITKKGYVGYWLENTYYYFDDVKDNNGTFCKYSDGESKEIIDDVYIWGVNIYDKNYMTGYDEYKDYSGDLYIYNSKGEDTKVASDVYGYTVIAIDRIVFLKDDDLYVYTGDEDSKKIEKDVKEYFCPVVMKRKAE